eukprot:gene1082-2113_t
MGARTVAMDGTEILPKLANVHKQLLRGPRIGLQMLNLTSKLVILIYPIQPLWKL